jgi:hypothetical protein
MVGLTALALPAINTITDTMVNNVFILLIPS